MRKHFILLFALGLTFSAHSQIQFGVKAGMNISTYTFHGYYVPQAKTKFGVNAGILADIPLFSDFHLQPEVMYSGEGYNQSTDSLQGLTTNNINVPILFKYQAHSGFFAETGPQIGFMLSTFWKYQGQSTDVSDYYPTIKYSWAVGMGYKFPSTNLGVDVRYIFDLTNIYKKSNGGSYENSHVFQIGVFYLFGRK